MRKKLSAIFLVMFIAIQLSPFKVNASTFSSELKVSSELTQWVLDEPANTLYGISEKGKNLMFINSTTMSIEKNLTLNGCPTDIIQDGGYLYIALDDINQIIIVDMASKAITGILYTSSDPYRLEKDGDKIYYTQRDQWCKIYEYNLTTNTDQIISVDSFYQPDLAINTNNHILYIGESGLSGSNMTYYSTIDNKVIGKTNYDGGYGFPNPGRYSIFDGTNVYYAGRDFKPDDPSRFNGDFGSTEKVIYASKGLVYTNKSIYSKDTHIKLGDFGLNVDLVQASDNTLFIYSKDNGIIKRFSDPDNKIDDSNVIALISGNPTDPITNTEQSIQINSGMSILQMKSKLIKWVSNEPTNTLYGISKDDKALFFINAQTLNLEKSLTFPCSPTDIIQDGGNLYIALDDANQIVIVDMASKAIIGTLYTSSDPYRIEKDGDKIYYSERDQWSKIYQYNLTTNIDQTIPVNSVYQPDLAINTNDHILYIGESGSSGSNMTYYSTSDNRVIGKTNYNGGYGFPYPGRYTIFDGEKVYYAGFAFDKQNPARILGSFGDEDIVFAKYGTAFTKTSLYDSESYSLIGYIGTDFNLIEISDQLVMFFYHEGDNSILKVDPSKIAQVQFDSQGGSDIDDIVVDNNSLIQAPAPPTRAGYTFAGWYKEPECINPWNFNTDKATFYTTLYAKWTYIPSVINGWSYFQGQWYFFNNSTMVTSSWKQDSSKRWFYLDTDGAMVTSALRQDSSKRWFYLGADGAMVTNAWRQDSSKHWLYLGNDGAMVTNAWRQDSSKHWFYLGVDGSMVTDTWVSYNGKWYYLKANGEMATGWLFNGGAWYYLYASGEMASNTIINGYKLNGSGVWIE